MATVKWNGGASTTTQVDTLTPGGTIEATDVFSVTLTGEDGTAVTVDAIAGGTSVADVTASVQAACAASTNDLFTAVTFADITTAITVTANIAGVPFYCTVATTETGGGAADAQTFNRAATTASSGPNDFNTDANWEGGSAPSAADDVIVSGSLYSILFGLDQSTLNLTSFRVGRTFKGTVGDANSRYDLQLGTITDVSLDSISGPVRLDSTATNVIIKGTATGSQAVVLGTQATNLSVGTSEVTGNVDVKASTSVSTLRWMSPSATATLTVGASVSATTVYFKGGTCEWNGGTIASLDIIDGNWRHLAGNITAVDVDGGVLDFRAGSTLTLANISDGMVTFANSEKDSTTLTNANVRNGTLDLRNAVDNITVSNNIVTTLGKVVGDVGQTINPKA